MNDELIFDIDEVVNEIGKDSESIENIEDGDSENLTETGAEPGNVTESGTALEEIQQVPESGNGSGFEIQADTFEQQGQVSSSLCDRFGVHMFTDEFQQKEAQQKKEQKSEKERILKEVIVNQKESPLNESFQKVMNAETRTVLKTEYLDEQNQTSMLSILSYGFLGMFLTGTVLFYIEKRRRRRQKLENHNYNPERYDE